MRASTLSIIGTTCFIVCAGCGDSGADRPTERGWQSLGPDAAITATPSSDLLDGQSVTLAVTDFPSNAGFGYGQCRANPTSKNDCAAYSIGLTTPAGTAGLMLRVFRSFSTTTGEFVSCEAPGSCVVGASTSEQLNANAVFAPISFRDVGPVTPPQYSIAITPNVELADYQEVTVTSSGFPRRQPFSIAECPATWRSLDTDCLLVDGGSDGFDSDGNYMQIVRVQHDVQLSNGSSFSCDEPGSCVLVARRTVGVEASAPLAFRTMGAPRKGTCTAPPPLGDWSDFEVTVSGWASNVSLRYRICPADSATREELCTYRLHVPLNLEGSATFTLTARDWLRNGTRLVDCTSAPGACVIELQDPRDPANTTLDVPLTVTNPMAMRGTATVEAPFVDGALMRVSGSGWSNEVPLEVLMCATADFSGCVTLDTDPYVFRSELRTSATGTFRSYLIPGGSLRNIAGGDVDCRATPNRCSLVITDPRAYTATAIRIPIAFQTGASVEIASRYEPEFEALLEQGVRISGWSPGELQRQGGARAVWVLGYGGARTGARFATTGTTTHITSYTLDEYRVWAQIAWRYDYTVEELQKTGALFWSWVIAGFPPFPEPS
jgi:hypothetical protein